MSLYVNKITEVFLIKSYFILFSMSFALSLTIVLTAQLFFNKRFERDQKAIQSAHKGFVPRVGGLAIYFSLIVFSFFINVGFLDNQYLPNLEMGDINLIILSALPIFLVGLAEDLGAYMKPKVRLFAAAVSGLFAIIFLKVWVSTVGIPLIDIILLIAPFGIVFTLFATTGVVNAFNLIDGLNGLAGYVSVSIAIALSVIAFNVNNLEILRFLFLMSACVLGFLFLNFPFGKIFLGDAGAYILGHFLVWSAIIIVNINSSVSSFAILLIFFWPIADTLLSIWRRFMLKRRADQPDRLHFHQLVMRFLEIRFLGRRKRNISNPLATLILIPAISAPQILGVIFWDNNSAAVWAIFLVGFSFVFSYLIGLNTARRIRHLS